MARYGKKRKRNRIIIATFILIIVIVACLTYYFQMKKIAADPGYGTIQNLSMEQDIMEVDDWEDEDGSARAKMTCMVMDVGDAEAVLVDIGQTEILYDAGYAENGDYVVKKLNKYINGNLDFVIVSHSHADHCGGIPKVMKAFDVDTVITSGEISGTSEQFDKAMESIEKENCTVVPDENLTFDLGNDAVLYIIEGLDPKDTDEPNDLSVCAYIKYGNDGILITGDSEEEGEKALKGKLSDHEITLFVAGHHMSSTSNNAVLLEEWNPQYIFASCAGPDVSEYGFPHKTAVERCLEVTGDVYATYQCGDLVLKMNGQGETTLNVENDKALKGEKNNFITNLF